MIQGDLVVSPGTILFTRLYKTEESILLKMHPFVDFLERNLSFAANGMWKILVSRNNKNTVEEAETMH